MTPTTEQLKDLLDKVTPGEWLEEDGWIVGNEGCDPICMIEHGGITDAFPTSRHDATLIALAPTLAAEVVRLREALEALHSLASFHQEFYDRNGPQWTSAQGNEYEDTSAHLDSMNALADFARQALDATSEK